GRRPRNRYGGSPSPELAVAESGIEEVAQSVAEEVGAEHDERDGGARDGGQPPRVAQVIPSLGHHVSPGWPGRLNPQPEKAEAGFEQHHGGELGGADDEE